MPTSSFFNQNQPHLKKHSYRLNHHVKYYRYMKTSDVPSHHRSISSTAILQSTSTPSSESSRLPPLLSSISSDTIATIQTLPEISDIISNIDTDTDATSSKNCQQTIEGLKRASQVFQQYNPQGEEYKAVLLLQVHTLIQSESYVEALDLLESADALECNWADGQRFDIDSERVRIMYYLGKFDDADVIASDLCDLALQIDSLQDYDYGLRQGVAMNSLALCRLAAVGLEDVDILAYHSTSMDGANSNTNDLDWRLQMENAEGVKDFLKMASKMLEKGYNQGQDGKLGLACAASYSNQGVAELIAILIKSQLQSMPVPIDPAMKTWREALNVLDDLEREQSTTKLSRDQMIFLKTARARVYCNMTWAILFNPSYANSSHAHVNLKEDSLKLSSEYAGLALKATDETGTGNGNLGRVLGLVASCYGKAGSAVTSEGLLQSAMDASDLNMTGKNNPLSAIDARSALVYYSKLCDNWEKRGGDAEKYRALALEMDGGIVDAWKGKSSIYSGTMLFSTGDLF